jgi:hypothetical protein
MYDDLQLLTVYRAETVKLHLEDENSHALWNISKSTQHNTVSSSKNGNKISYIQLGKPNKFSKVIQE